MAHILVADDDHDVCELVMYKLQAAGHTVDVVNDGDAAIEAWRANAYDVAIVDWMMPGRSGLDVCATIKAADPDHPRLILLTAKAQPADEVAARGVAVDDFVTKPFSPRELAARVEALAAPRPS